MVTIELFGVPRLRAGIARRNVAATTVGSALMALVGEFPALDDLLRYGEIHPAYRLSLNGERFVTDLDTALREGDSLLLLSADVGG